LVVKNVYDEFGYYFFTPPPPKKKKKSKLFC
jgi:hypothetical protein